MPFLQYFFFVFIPLIGVSTAWAGDAALGKIIADRHCASCHGADGNSNLSAIPSLAEQHQSYLVKEMQDYQQKEKGGRNSPVMAAFVATLSAADIENVASYYSAQILQGGTAKPDLIARGEALYRGGNRLTGVPACMACHGPDGSGLGQAKYPMLSGQHPEYTVAQLKAFRDGTRSNAPNHIMTMAVARMTDAEMIAVASYLYGLQPIPTDFSW